MRKVVSLAFSLVFLPLSSIAGECRIEKSGGVCSASCSTGTLSLVCSDISCSSSCTDQRMGGKAYLSSVYRDIYLSGNEKVSDKAIQSLFTDDFRKANNKASDFVLDGKKFNVYIDSPAFESITQQQKIDLTKELVKLPVEDLKSPSRFEFRVKQFK